MAFMSINGLRVPVRRWSEDQEIIGEQGRAATTGAAYRNARAYKRSWKCQLKPLTIEQGRVLRGYANANGAYLDQPAGYASNGLVTSPNGSNAFSAVGSDGFPAAQGVLGGFSQPFDLRKNNGLGIVNKITALPGAQVFSAALNNGTAPTSVFSVGSVAIESGSAYFGNDSYRISDGANVRVGDVGSFLFSGNAKAGVWVRNLNAADLGIEVGFLTGAGTTLVDSQTYLVPPFAWVWCETGFLADSGSDYNLAFNGTLGNYLVSGFAGFDGILGSTTEIGPLLGTDYVTDEITLPSSIFDLSREGAGFSCGAWLFASPDTTNNRRAFSFSGTPGVVEMRQLASSGAAVLEVFGRSILFPGFGSADLGEALWLGLSWDAVNPTNTRAVAYNVTRGAVVFDPVITPTENTNLRFTTGQTLLDTPGFASNLAYFPYPIGVDALSGLPISARGAPLPAVSLEGDFLPDDENGVRALMTISFDELRRFREGVWRNSDRSMNVEFVEV